MSVKITYLKFIPIFQGQGVNIKYKEYIPRIMYTVNLCLIVIW